MICYHDEGAAPRSFTLLKANGDALPPRFVHAYLESPQQKWRSADAFRVACLPDGPGGRVRTVDAPAASSDGPFAFSARYLYFRAADPGVTVVWDGCLVDPRARLQSPTTSACPFPHHHERVYHQVTVTRAVVAPTSSTSSSGTRYRYRLESRLWTTCTWCGDDSVDLASVPPSRPVYASLDAVVAVLDEDEEARRVLSATCPAYQVYALTRALDSAHGGPLPAVVAREVARATVWTWDAWQRRWEG